MIIEINDKNIIKDMFYNIFKTDLILNVYSKIIIYKENEILGFMVYDIIYDRCEIEYIGVLEQYRNKNIATKLLDYLSNYKLSNITLEVSQNNIPAISLYKKNNFKIVSTRKNYYDNEDAYLMIKEV